MRKDRGFTLIELIIVIIVIGILVAVAIPQYVRVAERGRVGAAKSRLDTIRKAEAIYYATNAQYTTYFDELTEEVPEVLAGLTEDHSDGNWTYSISCNPDCNTGFEAKAERDSGAYVNKTVTINQDGVIGGTHPLI